MCYSHFSYPKLHRVPRRADWVGLRNFGSKLVRQAYNCTQSGGWAEFQDLDTFAYSTNATLAPDSTLAKFYAMSGHAREAAGYEMKPGRLLEKWLQEAGFVNVTNHRIPLPLGTWPKNRHQKMIGAYNLL